MGFTLRKRAAQLLALSLVAMAAVVAIGIALQAPAPAYAAEGALQTAVTPMADTVTLTLKGSSIDGGNTAEDFVLEVERGSTWEDIDLDTKEGQILPHFTEGGYTLYGLYPRIMRKPLSQYNSWSEVMDENIDNLETEFNEDTTFYVAIAKYVDTVDLTIKPPLCGEVSEVVEEDSLNGKVLGSYPVVAACNGQVVPFGRQHDSVIGLKLALSLYIELAAALEIDIDIDRIISLDMEYIRQIELQLGMEVSLAETIVLYSLPGALWLKDKSTPLNGTLEGGKTYLAEVGLAPKFGYQFDPSQYDGNSDVPAPKLTVTNANGDEEFCEVSHSDVPWGFYDERLVRFTIDAEHDWGEWEVTKEPTTTSEGVETRVCKADPSHTETRPIPKLKPEPAASKVGGTLLAKLVAKGSNRLVLSWNKIAGADGYDVFFSKCNHLDKKETCRKIKTIKGNGTFKFTKNGLKSGKAYKAYVKAFVMRDGKKTYVKKSPMVHAFTSGYLKNYTNPKKVTVKQARVSLAVGQTHKVKAGVVKLMKGKMLISARHAPKLRYKSSDTDVATVSKSGKITAKAAGTCKVYVIAVNGARRAVQVTVG